MMDSGETRLYDERRLRTAALQNTRRIGRIGERARATPKHLSGGGSSRAAMKRLSGTALPGKSAAYRLFTAIVCMLALCIAGECVSPDRSQAQAASLDAGIAVAAPKPAAQPEAAQLLMAGKAAMQDGLYELAQQQFELRLANLDKPSKERDETSVLLIRALRAQRKHAEILKFLEDRKNWTKEAAVTGVVEFWRATALYELKRFDEALAELNDFDKRFPGGKEYAEPAKRLMAWCNLGAGKADKAFELFASFDKEHGDSSEALPNLLDWGKALLATGRIDKAGEVLARFTNNVPDTAVVQEGQYWLAQAFIQDRKWRDATEILTALAGNDKADDDLRAQAWYSLATTCEGITNRNDAIVALSNGLARARAPELKRKGTFDLGVLLLDTGNFEQSVPLIKAFVSAQPGDPQSAAAQLKLAQTLLDHKKYREAVDEFQGYLETFTNSTGVGQAYQGRGWGLLSIGRYAEAATSFSKAYDVFKDVSKKDECLFKVGDSYFANGQFKLAEETYNRLLTEFPGSRLVTNAIFQLAESMTRANELDAAEKAFAELAEKHAGTSFAEEALLRVAEIKSDRGHWSEALECFDNVMNVYSNGPFFAEALQGRGLIRYRLFMFDDALADFERIVRDFPNSAPYEQAFYMRGMCCYWMGRDDEAVTICKDSVNRYPDSKWAPDIMFWLGKHEYNQGNYETAETNFVAFVEKHPDNNLADEALLRAGLAASRRKEYVRAVGLFARLVKEYPNSKKTAEARFAQADALCELADFPAAILICEEIINKYPDSEWSIPAWARKGDCQFGMGADNPKRYAESIESYRVAAGSSTNNPNVGLDLVLKAEYQIGAALEKMGRTSEAFDQYYVKVIVPYLAEREKGVWHTEESRKWFTRAAFNASDIMAAKQNWRSAVGVLERVVKAGVPAAAEAEERAGKIKSEHWWLFR
jgi:TolA-binding protein